MYLWVRLPRILAAAKLARRVDPMAEVRTRLRVLPGDIDPFNHLNNGRYLTICDLGRFDWAMRSGMLAVFHKQRWVPVIATAAVSYRRSLELFQKFELSTQLIYWDAKWFYIEHGFYSGGALCCKVILKGAVLDGTKRHVPLAKVVETLGESERSAPPMPDLVKDWSQWEKHLRR